MTIYSKQNQNISYQVNIANNVYEPLDFKMQNLLGKVLFGWRSDKIL